MSVVSLEYLSPTVRTTGTYNTCLLKRKKPDLRLPKRLEKKKKKLTKMGTWGIELKSYHGHLASRLSALRGV